LAFAIAWEIANREEKLKVDKIWVMSYELWVMSYELVFLELSLTLNLLVCCPELLAVVGFRFSDKWISKYCLLSLIC
jgi:hypothetical protein